ncbi:MAG: ABC transporter permease [Brochothrix thermosphacta]|uniref:ABC transporter permease n=1 Tax=Brochothrix thermosphacta TaxID=2756 RepID=UPI000EB8BD37|nr:ABC transporter permease [Brochothrix thermosphacta]HCZ39287.1 hypothetical protein [Brochothrix thermosphacta]HCZ46178.1 hypothetical protein [Brochothrix thermosphacta]
MMRIKALIWLRTNIIWSNKNMLLLIAMPFMMSIFYGKWMVIPEEQRLAILLMCLAMSFAFAAGNMVVNFIAEEKEKNNLRALMLAGINSFEYIAATLFFPVIIGLIALVAVPQLTGTAKYLKGNVGPYMLLGLMTMLVVVLLNLMIAIASKTQTQAQITALPITLMTTFLPMVAGIHPVLQVINNYTFMGDFTLFFNNLSIGKVSQSPPYVSCIWLISLIILNVLLFKRNQRQHVK